MSRSRRTISSVLIVPLTAFALIASLAGPANAQPATSPDQQPDASTQADPELVEDLTVAARHMQVNADRTVAFDSEAAIQEGVEPGPVAEFVSGIDLANSQVALGAQGAQTVTAAVAACVGREPLHLELVRP